MTFKSTFAVSFDWLLKTNAVFFSTFTVEISSGFKIKVSLPNAVALKNNTNGLLTVSGISGNYLKIETLDNGSTELVGSIENLESKNTGNGVLNAKRLIVKNAIIKAFGNGNVYVNVSELITAKTFGNCTVINSGKAKFDASSSSSGNSRYVNN